MTPRRWRRRPEPPEGLEVLGMAPAWRLLLFSVSGQSETILHVPEATQPSVSDFSSGNTTAAASRCEPPLPQALVQMLRVFVLRIVRHPRVRPVQHIINPFTRSRSFWSSNASKIPKSRTRYVRFFIHSKTGISHSSTSNQFCGSLTTGYTSIDTMSCRYRLCLICFAKFFQRLPCVFRRELATRLQFAPNRNHTTASFYFDAELHGPAI